MLVGLDASRVQRRLKAPFEEQAVSWTPPSLLLSHCPSIRMASICDHRYRAKYHIQNAMSLLARSCRTPTPAPRSLSRVDRTSFEKSNSVAFDPQQNLRPGGFDPNPARSPTYQTWR